MGLGWPATATTLLVGAQQTHHGSLGPIVAFGDSYTLGSGAPAGEDYPSRLAVRLGVQVINSGVHGSTAKESLHRVEGDVLAHHPWLVIICFGVNEAFRGEPVEAAIDGLDQIMRRIAAHHVPMVLVGVHHGHFQEDFDRALERLALHYDAELVLDALAGVLERPATRSDAHHPNGDGYEIMTERIRPAVVTALA